MTFVDLCSQMGVTRQEVPVLLDYLIMLRTQELRTKLLPTALRAVKRSK